MFSPIDLFGREGMTGVILYLAVAYVASGVLAERHADKHLVAECRSGHLAAGSVARPKSVEEHSRDVAAGLLEQQGGAWGALLAKGLRLKSQWETTQAALNAATGASTCSCRVRQALRKPEVRWSWAVYVATWKLVDDAPSATLAAAAVIDAAAACTGGSS